MLVVNGQVLEYGEPDQLYLNDGKGRFTPVSWTGGPFLDEDGKPLTQPPLDWGLTAAFRDINGDGLPDLYVCNDFWTPDRIWLNDGKGHFRAAPRLALRNMSASSMGVDFADIESRRVSRLFRRGHVEPRSARCANVRSSRKRRWPSAIGAIDDRPQFMRNTLFLESRRRHVRGDRRISPAWRRPIGRGRRCFSTWTWMALRTCSSRRVTRTTCRTWMRRRRFGRGSIRGKDSPTRSMRQKAFTKELMEHMRLYPPLDTPIVAFHNRGDVTIRGSHARVGHGPARRASCASRWRTSTAMAISISWSTISAAPPGSIAMKHGAPRVAVRLRGSPPNTQGIGAKIRLLGGAVPEQSQEVMAGGRYMSGSEPLLVFAAGKTAIPSMTLEVTWRSGKFAQRRTRAGESHLRN